MHLKSWRFWLALAALIGVVTPWRAMIAVAGDEEMLDRVLASFLTVPFQGALLLIPVLIVIAVDSIARVRTAGVHALLYTKPFATLSLVTGAWAAIVALGALLAGGTLLAHFLIVRYVLHLEVYAAPLGWILLVAALPLAMIVAAVAVWARIVFGYMVLAYIAAGAALVLLVGLTQKYNLPLAGLNGKLIEPLIAEYVPAIGRDVDWRVYGPAMLNALLVSMGFLSVSCYHLRRRELQGTVLGRYGKHWSDMPTFIQLFDGFRIDRHAGAATHLASLATLALAGLVIWQSATRGRAANDRMQRWAVELKRDLREQAPANPGLQIRRYTGDVRVESRYDIGYDLRLEIENTTKSAVADLALTFPFGMEVSTIEGAGGEALQRRQWGNVLVARLPRPLDPQATTTVRLACAGRPMELAIGDFVPFTTDYDVRRVGLEDRGIWLTPNHLQLQSWLLPRAVAIERRPDGMAAVEMPRLFTADLVFTLFREMATVSPDGDVEALNDQPGRVRRRLRLDRPQGDFVLFAGPYERLGGRFGTLNLAIYCFAQDRATFEFAVHEMAETLERWGRILGPPEPRPYALIETPSPYRADDGSPAGTICFADIQSLRRYRPLFVEREPPGVQAVYRFQSTLSSALASQILRESFHPERRIARLRDTLYWYLTFTVQRSSLGPTARRVARLFARESPGLIEEAYLDPQRKALFDTPLLERMAQANFESYKETHIWRMLHYLLDDDKFALLVRRLLAEHHGRILTLEDLEAAAESVYGEPLDWFFRQWFYGRGVPAYEILEARATLSENPVTRDIEYDVRIRVRNKGVGRMPVPIVLLTERDRITRKVWLDSGGQEQLQLHVPDRPELVFVDPEGWIIQEAFRDPDSGTRGVVRRKVRVLE
jgi:hypothetical protein